MLRVQRVQLERMKIYMSQELKTFVTDSLEEEEFSADRQRGKNR